MYRKYRIQRKSLLYSGHRFINNLKILLFNACGSNKCTKTRLDSNTSMMRSILDIGWKRMKRLKVRPRCILGMTVYQIFLWGQKKHKLYLMPSSAMSYRYIHLSQCLVHLEPIIFCWYKQKCVITGQRLYLIYSVPAYVNYK